MKSKYQSEALSMFLQGKTPKEIAKTLPLKLNSLYRWMREGNWDSLKEKQQHDQTLQYITQLLEQEKIRHPDQAVNIDWHIVIINQAFTGPANMFKARLAQTLTEIEASIRNNLISSDNGI